MSSRIELRVIKEEDFPEVLEFMSQHFYGSEPLTSSEPEGINKTEQAFFQPYIAHGLSYMAEEISNANGKEQRRIVAANIAAPNHAGQIEELENLSKQGDPNGLFNRVLQFVVKMEKGADVFNRYGVTKVLHSHLTGVHEDMRGKAIGMRLRENLVAIGKQLGYELLTVDCTSFYSARQSENLGMDCVYEIVYKDYLRADGRPMFTPKAPHVRSRSFAMRL